MFSKRLMVGRSGPVRSSLQCWMRFSSPLSSVSTTSAHSEPASHQITEHFLHEHHGPVPVQTADTRSDAHACTHSRGAGAEWNLAQTRTAYRKRPADGKLRIITEECSRENLKDFKMFRVHRVRTPREGEGEQTVTSERRLPAMSYSD